MQGLAQNAGLDGQAGADPQGSVALDVHGASALATIAEPLNGIQSVRLSSVLVHGRSGTLTRSPSGRVRLAFTVLFHRPVSRFGVSPLGTRCSPLISSADSNEL